MLIYHPAGPILVLADPRQPTADGVLIHAWRADSISALLPSITPKPTSGGIAPFEAIVSRRELTRALSRQLFDMRHQSIDQMAGTDDLLRDTATEALSIISVLDWSPATLHSPEPDAADTDHDTDDSSTSDDSAPD